MRARKRGPEPHRLDLVQALVQGRGGWAAHTTTGRGGEPNRYYAEEWQGWGDFVGTGALRPRDREFREFAEARSLVRSLGFRTVAEWRAWCRGIALTCRLALRSCRPGQRTTTATSGRASATG